MMAAKSYLNQLNLDTFRFTCSHVKPHSEMNENEVYDPTNSDCLVDSKGNILKWNGRYSMIILKNLIFVGKGESYCPGPCTSFKTYISDTNDMYESVKSRLTLYYIPYIRYRIKDNIG